MATAVALTFTAAACGSDTSGGTTTATGTPTSASSATTGGAGSPTTGATSGTATPGAWTPETLGPATVTLPDGPVDQTPPKGTNGVAWDGRRLWVADLAGSQILAVDPRTGAIEGRFGADQGVTGPDDLAVGPDGAVYWTGFNDGTVGRLGPDGRSTAIADVGAGANPIAFSPDGSLYVGRAVTADGLYRLDPTGATPPREVAPSVGNVNGFAFGPDGALYGPSYQDQQGSLVRIDPTTGAVTEVLGGLGFPSAVKFGPDGKAYVLTSLPVGVLAVDLTTGASTPYATPLTKAVDNLAYDGDGSFVVSSFNEPVLSVIPPAGGEVRTVRLGRA
jgi:streptogramin lyase